MLTETEHQGAALLHLASEAKYLDSSSKESTLMMDLERV
jgi:hypothetical protein